MDIKKLIEGVIASLTSENNIESILLQSQAIAHLLHNDDFSKWIKCELRGYDREQELPSYRKQTCQVRVDIQRGFQIINNFSFPPGALDKKYDKLLFTMDFYNPLPEIESMSKGHEDGTLINQVPAFAYPIMNKVISGDINNARQVLSPQSLVSIITTVKTNLLDFFLQLNDSCDGEIDFSKLEQRKEITHIMNQTINAANYLSGTGTINTFDSDNIGNNSTSISPEVKNQIQELIQKVQEITLQDSIQKEDRDTTISTILSEVQNPKPRVSVIRRSIGFLKSIPTIMLTHGIEDMMDSIIRILSQ